MISYDKRDILSHDIALIVIRNRTRARRYSRRNINLSSVRNTVEEGEVLSVVGSGDYKISDGGECDSLGLTPAHLCLTRPSNDSLSQLPGRDYVGRVVLDPSQGYYRLACLHRSGLAIQTSFQTWKFQTES